MKNKQHVLNSLTAVFALSLSASAIAQQQVSGAISTPGIGTPGSVAIGGDTTGSQSGRAWSISPRIGLSMTATDNVNVSGNANSQSDLITEISPGIRIEARTARLRGHLDYSLRGQFYADTSSENRHQNDLNAFATLEAVDDWFFVDVSGNISQQAISAFGPQSPSNSSINSNSTETSSYRLSPYIRGRISSLADYVVRYNASATRADATNASDVDVSQWIAQLRGGTPFQSLKWTIDGNRQTTDYALGRETDSDLVRFLATYLITPQFSISGSAGWESNNYASIDDESQNTHGYGFDWNPTTRTQISGFKERRFFGDGHRFSFSHRFPMSSIRYTDTRDVSVLPNQFASTGMGTIYDLYFEQFATQIPDPILRAAFVNALLMASGINPNQQVVSGFIGSQATVQRQQQLAFVLFGVRNSLTVQFNRSENSSIAAAAVALDDFAQTSKIYQKGVSVTFSHRLSALSNLNATVSRQESSGRNGGSNNLDTSTTLYQVSMATKLGAKTNGSLSVRRSEYDGSTNPYTENALLGTITYVY